MKKIAILFFLLSPFMIMAQVQKSKSEDHVNFLNAQVMVGGKTGGEIIREEFFDSKGIVVISNDSSSYTITRFRMAVIARGEKELNFWNNTSGSLTPEMLEALQNIRKGGTVMFEYLTAKNQSGESFPLKPFQLKVTE